MRDKRAMLMGGLLLLVVSAVAASALRAKLVGRRVAEIEPRLQDSDPARQLEAASAILRLDPTHRAAVLTRIRALMDDGRRTEARQLLAGLEEDPALELTDTALGLHAESYFDEAGEVLLASGPSTIDSSRDSIEKLLDSGSVLRKQVAATTENEPDRAIAEAEELDQRASLLWHLAQVTRIQVSRDRDSGINEQTDLQVVQLNDYVTQIKQLDARAGELAGKAVKARANDERGELVLFHTRLRAGDFDGARRVAATIAAQPRLTGVVAGEIADTLLNLDRFFPSVSTDDDVVVARRVLTRTGLVGAQSIRIDLAAATLAQRDGNLAEAESILRKTLERNPGNPRATCMLGMTLVHMGLPRDAVALLAPFNERSHLAEGKIAMAAAQIAAGETGTGQDTLRESLQSEPDNLPAQLMLIGAMIDSGATIEAEPHIATAAALSPDDPRIKSFRAILMIEKLDHRGLANLLLDRKDAPDVDWRHAALAAAMVVDDLPLCDELLAEFRASMGNDPLRLVAEGWRRTVARKRAEVAALVARVILDQVDNDPMRWPRSTATPVVAEANFKDQSDALTKMHYVPLPRQIAMELTEVALARWPKQPVLLDLSARLAIWLDQPRVARERLDRLVSVTTGGLTPAAAAMRAYLDGSPGTVSSPSSSMNEWLRLVAAVAGHDRQAVLAALNNVLTEQAWAEPALLMVLRDAAARRDGGAAEEALGLAEKISKPRGLLSRARWELAFGKFQEALQTATDLMNSEESDSETRVQGAEVAARADLALGHLEQASGVFEGLAYSVGYRHQEMQACAVDVNLACGRTREAASALGSLMMEPQSSPRTLDRLLATARTIMAPPRLQVFVDQLLLAQPDNPILLVYKTWCLADAGRMEDAREVAKRVSKLSPDSPRTRALLAGLTTGATQPTTAATVEGGGDESD